jgi:hypothetical protein
VSDTATEAKEQSKALAGETTEATEQIAQTAKDKAATVAQGAKEQVSQVATEAKTQAKNVARDTREQLRAQADEQATKVAGSIRRISDEFRALCEGRADDAGTVRQYLGDAGGQLDQFAQRIDTRGFEGIIDDVQRFARRRPGVFLAAAAGAGFLTGRVFRSVNDGSDDAPASSQRPLTGEIRGPASAQLPARWEAS